MLSTEPYLTLFTPGGLVLLTPLWCPGAQDYASKAGAWGVGAPLANRAGVFTWHSGPLAALCQVLET